MSSFTLVTFSPTGNAAYLADLLAQHLDEHALHRYALEEIATGLLTDKVTALDPSLKARLVNTLGKAESLAARAFGLELHATEACTSCGLCWERCPVQNITEGKHGRPRFHAHCLMCLRCVYGCPVQAIKPRFSVFVPIKGGYRLADYLKDT